MNTNGHLFLGIVEKSRNHDRLFSPHCNALMHAACILVDFRASSPEIGHVFIITF
jgi:hypothetical protein